MTDPLTWLLERPHRYAPLFDHDELVVSTMTVGSANRLVLRRHTQMEQAVIEIVTSGLQRPDWLGLLYIMVHGTLADFRPRYIGITARTGRDGNISANMATIATNSRYFARWGDSRYYHIGDLSAALLQPVRGGAGARKYANWVDDLFLRASPPTLREPVSFYATSWHVRDLAPTGRPLSLQALEQHLIYHIGLKSPRPLLNDQHNPRPYGLSLVFR
jgi:hypothetical protein